MPSRYYLHSRDLRPPLNPLLRQPAVFGKLHWRHCRPTLPKKQPTSKRLGLLLLLRDDHPIPVTLLVAAVQEEMAEGVRLEPEPPRRALVGADADDVAA